MLVANKIDEPIYFVSRKEGQELAKTYGMLFQETSAKTRENVDSVFRELVKKIVQSEPIDTLSYSVIELDEVPPRKNKCSVVVVLGLIYAEARLSFVSQVPNGARVPDPCDPSHFVEAIGHENSVGGGLLNEFGVDFEAAKDWQELCRLDSDRDGKTNGEELGDPLCQWQIGKPDPEPIEALTHPSVCTPIESTFCIHKNPCQMDEVKLASLDVPDDCLNAASDQETFMVLGIAIVAFSWILKLPLTIFTAFRVRSEAV
ncbi:hypothetical protein Ciccas_010002 [Cichlidogyrus casuarinus]|uniref:Temptin Cys/Cys disulfide domain-containing protein n=1 Tax=Cichlidogyrus casuarinus TaxID=1844966 RepID=A0ABD2PWF7_9PLAT